MTEQPFDKKIILADISLLLVALFWGSNFVVTKDALEVIAPFTYLWLRFSVAALLLAIIFWKRLLKASAGDYLAGCLIGLFLFSGYGFQTIGHHLPAVTGLVGFSWWSAGCCWAISSFC